MWLEFVYVVGFPPCLDCSQSPQFSYLFIEFDCSFYFATILNVSQCDKNWEEYKNLLWALWGQIKVKIAWGGERGDNPISSCLLPPPPLPSEQFLYSLILRDFHLLGVHVYVLIGGVTMLLFSLLDIQVTCGSLCPEY